MREAIVHEWSAGLVAAREGRLRETFDVRHDWLGDLFEVAASPYLRFCLAVAASRVRRELVALRDREPCRTSTAGVLASTGSVPQWSVAAPWARPWDADTSTSWGRVEQLTRQVELTLRVLAETGAVGPEVDMPCPGAWHREEVAGTVLWSYTGPLVAPARRGPQVPLEWEMAAGSDPGE